MVTAFGSDARLSIGQRGVAPGENEITAARALLAALTLEGVLVTGDAIHAQAETAQLILDRGGDYLFALKANRPAMLEAVAAFFSDPPAPLLTFATTDANHGRIEARHHRVSHCIDWLFGDRAEPGAPRMPGLATLACVTARRDDGPPSTRYYLSSARLTPERFAKAVRSHWAIENSLHWVLDVTFDEDAARNRADNGPENLAILRRLAINVLQTQDRSSPSAENESAPDGPMTSPDPSSVKCDSPAAPEPAACPRHGIGFNRAGIGERGAGDGRFRREQAAAASGVRGEVTALDRLEFKDLSKLDLVGMYPSYASAHAAWKAKAQATVDNAQMRYVIVHLHRLIDPATA